jgi:hypothetical protein
MNNWNEGQRIWKEKQTFRVHVTDFLDLQGTLKASSVSSNHQQKNSNKKIDICALVSTAHEQQTLVIGYRRS